MWGNILDGTIQCTKNRDQQRQLELDELKSKEEQTRRTTINGCVNLIRRVK